MGFVTFRWFLKSQAPLELADRLERARSRAYSDEEGKDSMAQKLDDKELFHPHELMMSNVIQIDAIAEMLIEKDIIT